MRFSCCSHSLHKDAGERMSGSDYPDTRCEWRSLIETKNQIRTFEGVSMNPVNPPYVQKCGLALILLVCAFNAFGQGLVNFNNRSFGYPVPVVAPVFGVDPLDPYSQKHGNPKADWNGTNGPTPVPLGTQTYSGPPLTGTGYTATLWAVNST